MPDYGFARTYGAELLCTRPPTISKRHLLAALRSRCPGVTPLDRDAESGVLAFVHEDHPIQLADARIAAQTFIAVADKPLAPEALAESVQQSWTFPGAAAALHRSHATVVVTDLMSSALEYKVRLDLLQRALLGVLDVIPCEAIHWRPSQRLVDPLAFAEAGSGPPSNLFFAGALNVRLFNIQGREDETVMDTLGLAACLIFSATFMVSTSMEWPGSFTTRPRTSSRMATSSKTARPWTESTAIDGAVNTRSLSCHRSEKSSTSTPGHNTQRGQGSRARPSNPACRGLAALVVEPIG